MEAIDHGSLKEVLARAELSMADPALHIGRELSFFRPPARTLVIHIGNAADHVAEVVLAILSIDDSWFVIPRHGAAAELGLVAAGEGAAAVCVAPSERAFLGRYLYERPMDVGAASADLYVLGNSGNILVTWDHHTGDEGLSVQLRRIDDSNHLLVSLNEVGAEMEVF